MFDRIKATSSKNLSPAGFIQDGQGYGKRNGGTGGHGVAGMTTVAVRTQCGTNEIKKIREALQASLPVASEQLMTVQIPGTIIDTSYVIVKGLHDQYVLTRSK